eukprot:scaffold77600_cov52-Phaeocystis_antarctica.AAC.2
MRCTRVSLPSFSTTSTATQQHGVRSGVSSAATDLGLRSGACVAGACCLRLPTKFLRSSNLTVQSFFLKMALSSLSRSASGIA